MNPTWGSTITYTAVVDNAVSGSDLVLTLSNGEQITIGVGSSTGSVAASTRATRTSSRRS